MANAPKRIYKLTDKQARVILDSLAMQQRFFNRHMAPKDLRYLTKVRATIKLQKDRSSHAWPTLTEDDFCRRDYE